ncbi:hypothetical protein Tco_1277833, partial [Tanacetum coccineum]
VVIRLATVGAIQAGAFNMGDTARTRYKELWSSGGNAKCRDGSKSFTKNFHLSFEKYEVAAALLAEMEKKAVMAQTMLEATMQYSLAKTKGKPSLRFSNQDSSAIRTRQELTQEIPARDISLLCTPFGLDWGDRNKVSGFHKRTSRSER